MRSKIEHQEQIKVVNYLNILQKQGKVVEFFAIPNGGSRHKLEAINLKREGVKSGVSDLCVILKNRVLFIEMKRPAKKLKSGKLSYAGIKVSEHQDKFIENVSKSNVCGAVVCYGFDEAKSFIDTQIQIDKTKG